MPERKCSRLTLAERCTIAALTQAGFRPSQIARQLQRPRCTVSRELKRNTVNKHYDPQKAQALANKRLREKPKATKLTPELRAVIADKLRLDWSPEQIHGWLAHHGRKTLSHERIYQLVYDDQARGGNLWHHLRQARPKRRRRTAAKDQRGQLKNRRPIAERPPIVADKKRLGDWEIDTIHGHERRGALLSITERKSKLQQLALMPDRKSETTTQAAIRLLAPLIKHVHTITSDNGKEFAGHETIAGELQTDFYFADPYRACQRGLNENTNGLVRQYIPKAAAIDAVCQSEIDFIMARLNNRPRKTLNYNTPQEVFDALAQRAP